MDEVRRFLRYTLPGMASLGQLFLAVYFTSSPTILLLLKKLDSQAGLISGVIAVFITSGAIGYILASAYHTAYWTIFSFFSIDHLTIVRKLISRGELVVSDSNGDLIPEDKLEKRDAWTILTYYWHSNLEESKELIGLNKITDRLADFTHAHGASFLGAVLGLLVWFFWFSGFAVGLWSCVDWMVLVYWLILLMIYGAGHRFSNKALESMANAAVLTHMGKVGKFPVIIACIRKGKVA
jgi:hypothetical protein